MDCSVPLSVWDMLPCSAEKDDMGTLRKGSVIDYMEDEGTMRSNDSDATYCSIGERSNGVKSSDLASSSTQSCHNSTNAMTGDKKQSSCTVDGTVMLDCNQGIDDSCSAGSLSEAGVEENTHRVLWDPAIIKAFQNCAISPAYSNTSAKDEASNVKLLQAVSTTQPATTRGRKSSQAVPPGNVLQAIQQNEKTQGRKQSQKNRRKRAGSKVTSATQKEEQVHQDLPEKSNSDCKIGRYFLRNAKQKNSTGRPLHTNTQEARWRRRSQKSNNIKLERSQQVQEIQRNDDSEICSTVSTDTVGMQECSEYGSDNVVSSGLPPCTGVRMNTYVPNSTFSASQEQDMQDAMMQVVDSPSIPQNQNITQNVEDIQGIQDTDVSRNIEDRQNNTPACITNVSNNTDDDNAYGMSPSIFQYHHRNVSSKQKQDEKVCVLNVSDTADDTNTSQNKIQELNLKPMKDVSIQINAEDLDNVDDTSQGTVFREETSMEQETICNKAYTNSQNNDCALNEPSICQNTIGQVLENVSSQNEELLIESQTQSGSRHEKAQSKLASIFDIKYLCLPKASEYIPNTPAVEQFWKDMNADWPAEWEDDLDNW